MGMGVGDYVRPVWGGGGDYDRPVWDGDGGGLS